MPKNKSAVLRYRIIDGCLTNSMHPYPNLESIHHKVESQLDKAISISMLNKDLAAMKDIYGRPLPIINRRAAIITANPIFLFQNFP
jgi:hypothetical protein